MKIIQYLTVLALVCLASRVRADDWCIAVEMSYANLSGVRAYEASQNSNRNESKDLLVPSVLVSRTIGDKSEISLRYTLYDRIDGLGWSPDSNVFRVEGGGSRPVITPYIIEEEMSELTLSYLYDVWKGDKLSVKLGPNLSLYDSETDFFEAVESTFEPDINFYAGSGRGTLLGRRSSSDLAIGLEAKTTFKLTDRMGAAFTYRFSNPPDRDIHILSLAFKLKL